MLPLRKLLLATALATTIAASLFDLPGFEAAPPEKGAAAPTASTPVAASRPPIVPIEPLQRGRFEASAADLFAPRSWQPPPPPPSRPAAPKAPPLPFRYLGKVLEEGAVMAFVGQDARTHLLRMGDVLADYRVEEITPVGMTFVYLPLNEKQRLPFGSAN